MQQTRAVIPLFVVDPALWQPSGPDRTWFLAGCLERLDGELDGRLIVRHGDPAQVTAELCARHDVSSVFRAQDVGPYGRRRATTPSPRRWSPTADRSSKRCTPPTCG